jgi:O-acetylserine/cysteine efflux transporter
MSRSGFWQGLGVSTNAIASAAPSPWRPLLALAVLTAIWGVSVPVMKLGLRDIPPLGLVSLRYVCAAPVFALFLLRERLPPPRVLLAIGGLAALGLGAGQVLQIVGVQQTSAAVATIIVATIPIFTVLFAAVRLGQPVRAHHLAGLTVALAGIGLATAGASGAPSEAAAIGDVWLLLSSVCIAAYYVLGAELSLRHGVMTVSAWSTIFGALLLSPLALWEASAGHTHWTPTAMAVVAYLSLLVTVLGIWIWLHALRTLPVRVAASSQYVQPLVGIAASAAIFGTRLGLGFILGVVLVLVGIMLTNAARAND